MKPSTEFTEHPPATGGFAVARTSVGKVPMALSAAEGTHDRLALRATVPAAQAWTRPLTRMSGHIHGGWAAR
ncbi:hypothetical protein BCD48_03145 [Pseudofrankia sp. BMG5.36]|nr:hypothetical protein BCD48_03145 [Pseudofrankia sp. BMG5.36]